jgi:regulator of nucleoside diphosphate kinase
MVKKRSIIVTYVDMDRLSRLIRDLKHCGFRDQQQLEALDQALQSADVRPLNATPRGIIGMNSRVRVRDTDTQKEEFYTLVVPEEADMSRRFISVLAPLGIALLGHRKGAFIEAKVPGGIRRLKIKEVQRQRPAVASRESTGDRTIGGAALGLATGIGA